MIWRRIKVRSDNTIADLHYIIQIVMGLTDSHLHRFVIHGKDYGIAQIGGISFSEDPRRVKLADLGWRVKERFLYEYDFGDILLQNIQSTLVERQVAEYLSENSSCLHCQKKLLHKDKRTIVYRTVFGKLNLRS